MSGQGEFPEPPRGHGRRLTDPDPQLQARGPRHMKATPYPAPGPWATHRLVSIAARLQERRLNQRLVRYKLTISALDAMEAVAELQPATASDVAAVLCVSRQSVGKVMERLQSLGFLAKEPGRDGRSAYLHLTPEGRDVLSAAENLIQEGNGTEPADDYEFRHQLERHIRHLRNAEQAMPPGME